MTKQNSNLRFVIVTAGAVVVSVALGAAGMKWFSNHQTARTSIEQIIDDTLDSEANPADLEPTVPTIRPKRDPALTIGVNGFATVEAFFQSELRARSSGIIRALPKDIGDAVTRGELLLEVDVPDLEQDVAHRASLVEQRRQEVQVARTKFAEAEALRDVASASVRQKHTEVTSAEATTEFRRKQLERYRSMAGRDVVTPSVIEEQERDYQSVVASLAGAKVAVEKAEADVKEKESAIGTARAEIGLRQSMVDVALKDLDRARALADYARIRAPYDGVILKRNVDPGDFVQNATTGSSETLLTVARTDIVTVVSKLPENVAPFLNSSAEATMEFDDLPGVVFVAKLTRRSPSVQTSDRTVRVEVDLFNDGKKAYDKFATRAVAAAFARLAAVEPLPELCVAAAANDATQSDHKGASDPVPPLPILYGTFAREPRLLPGMVGTIHLQLQRFTDAYVIPTTAVFSRGGKSYIMEIRDGQTALVPVNVQLSDGKVAKVSVITRAPDGRGGTREVLRELTGKEELVASRQQELTAGRAVKTAPKDW